MMPSASGSPWFSETRTAGAALVAGRRFGEPRLQAVEAQRVAEDALSVGTELAGAPVARVVRVERARAGIERHHARAVRRVPGHGVVAVLHHHHVVLAEVVVAQQLDLSPRACTFFRRSASPAWRAGPAGVQLAWVARAVGTPACGGRAPPVPVIRRRCRSGSAPTAPTRSASSCAL